MALLNQFQHYSQRENTVTNNVLLMLSNLYEISPKYYEEFIQSLIEDSEAYRVIPDFRQQVTNRGDGIIDGFVGIKASKIIIETKIDSLEWIEKLLKYQKSFDEYEYNILIHLSKSKYPNSQVIEIKNRLNNHSTGKVTFESLTYQDLVDSLQALAETYPYEMPLHRLLENFENYCSGMNLLAIKNILRAMACGQSYNLNVKHQFYFDVATRGYSSFNYLGIYKDKTVTHIGEVDVVVNADLDDNNEFIKLESESELSEMQKKRLKYAIIDTYKEGWDIRSGHKFFLLKNFEETEFRKASKGGILRAKYINLEQFISNVSDNVKVIAEELRRHTWE